MIVIGCILCAWFMRRQGKLKSPILTFTSCRNREFALALIANVLLSMALCLAPFVLAIYLQTVRGFSAFQYGLLLLIAGIFSVGGAPISQKLYTKVYFKSTDRWWAGAAFPRESVLGIQHSGNQYRSLY